MKNWVFYHSVDLDGICSGAIIRFKLKSYLKIPPDAIEMYPINYGEPFPWDKINKEDIIYMADFSLNINDMKKLITEYNFIYIDHHKSAINEILLQKLQVKGSMDLKMAACELCWEYLFPNIKTPYIIKYLSKYDNWTKDNDWYDITLPLQYGIRLDKELQDPGNKLWEKLFTDPIFTTTYCSKALFNGKIAFKQLKSLGDIAIKSDSFIGNLDGIKVLCLNSSFRDSAVFEEYFDPSIHDACLVFRIDKNLITQVSLYTMKNNIDVSIISKKYGGGGHKQASGFQCKKLDIDGNYNIKVIK